MKLILIGIIIGICLCKLNDKFDLKNKAKEFIINRLK